MDAHFSALFGGGNDGPSLMTVAGIATPWGLVGFEITTEVGGLGPCGDEIFDGGVGGNGVLGWAVDVIVPEGGVDLVKSRQGRWIFRGGRGRCFWGRVLPGTGEEEEQRSEEGELFHVGRVGWGGSGKEIGVSGAESGGCVVFAGA